MAGAVRPVRVAVLFSRLSGYMVACLQELKLRHTVELMIVCRSPSRDAPFELERFGSLGAIHDRDSLDRRAMLDLLGRFDPQAVMMSGWFDPDYLHCARRLKRCGVPVIAGSDAQWSGSLRQFLGCIASPWYLHSAIDVLWVAGERQRDFAGRLGYGSERCWGGYYACDWQRYSSAPTAAADRDCAFLFVGRYVPVKGIDVLLDGYGRYRRSVDHPWELWCAGAGPLRQKLAAAEGVRDLGFIQPDELPAVMARAGAFVLPSRREPWGVVIQEASAAGLPLLCSDACGATVHLLQDGYNGYLTRVGDARHLAHCMTRTTELSAGERERMGAHGRTLSQQFTPDRWADTFVQGLKRL